MITITITVTKTITITITTAITITITKPITITRYVDGTPTFGVTPVNIRYIPTPHHGHTSQYHGHEWMTHILFFPCRSAVPFLRYGYFKLWPWNSRSMSWVWSKGKIIQLIEYPINSPPSNFTSIRPTIPEIQRFRNLTLQHLRLRSMVRSTVKVTYHTQYPTDAFNLPFAAIETTIPEIWPK